MRSPRSAGQLPIRRTRSSGKPADVETPRRLSSAMRPARRHSSIAGRRAVAAVTNARHRKMLELILGEMKEHLRVLAAGSRRPRGSARPPLGRQGPARIGHGGTPPQLGVRPHFYEKRKSACASPLRWAAISAIAARISNTRSTHSGSTSAISPSRPFCETAARRRRPRARRVSECCGRREHAAVRAHAAGAPARD